MRAVNSFFDDYATALESYHAKSMMQYYDLPCTFMGNDSHTVFNDAVQLESFLAQGAAFYKQHGIVNARPEVWSKYFWTDKIARIRLKWHYFDNNNQLLYSSEYQYLLKLDKNNKWKIAVAVSLNEKENMEAWLGSK